MESGVARATWLGVLLIAAPAHAAPTPPPIDRYVAALERLPRDAPATIAALEAIVREAPTWIPAHRALARIALHQGDGARREAEFNERLGRNPRDAGAAYGSAVLSLARGARVEAQRALELALLAGSRDPLLVEPLLGSNPAGARLLDWLEAEALRAPEDGPLVALAVRVSTAAGDYARAERLVLAGLRRHPGFGDLQAQRAALRRLYGDERAACEAATLAATYLRDEQSVPEVRVPRRLALARIELACGRIEAARQLVRTVGPTATVPGDPSWSTAVRLHEAELTLAAGDPLTALALITPERPGAERESNLRELWWALAIQSEARLGTLPEQSASWWTDALPAPSGLIDRTIGLAALWTAPPSERPEGVTERLGAVATAWEQAGLSRRAARAWLAAAVATGDREATRRALGNALVLSTDQGAPGEIRAASAVVRTALALAEQRDADAWNASQLDAAARLGTPPQLLARLESIGAEAALRVGDAAAAAQRARDGMLDLQEADRSLTPVPAELAPLVAELSDTALSLAGSAYRAARQLGQPVDQAGATLLRDVRRAIRRWSLLEPAWPETLESLTRLAPSGSCLVVALPGSASPALAAAHGEVEEATTAGVLESAACREARTVLWAGPAPAPDGLTTERNATRVVVRLIGPAVLPSSRLGESARLQPAWQSPVGPGPERPLRTLVTRLSQRPETDAPSDGNALLSQARSLVFHGPGLAPARAPLSAGWLVAPGSGLTRGWLGPENLSELTGDPQSGVIALGLRSGPVGVAPEGSWLLAEGVISAGWRWALLSRRPLSTEQRARLQERLLEWDEDPVREARRLQRADAETAAQLELWSASGRLIRVQPSSPIDTLLLVPMAAGVLLTILTLVRLLNRSRRASHPAPPPDPRDRSS